MTRKPTDPANDDREGAERTSFGAPPQGGIQDKEAEVKALLRSADRKDHSFDLRPTDTEA